MIPYTEITKTCKLQDYTEALFRIETWINDTHIFKCIWMWQNNGVLPSTIKYSLKCN